MALDTALSGGDLTTYQTIAYAGKWRMSLFPMTSFATARVNQSSFTTPLAQLTVDGTSADWLSVRKNMIAFVGTSAGAHDIGIYRVRETPGATTLYIMETSPGDPGLVAKRVTKLFVDNAYITIIDAPNIWSVFPRITYSGGAGTFLKDYDEAYVSQNSSSGAVPGIVRIGEHTIVKVADSATYTESRTATETLYGGAVSARQWTPPAGASLASGSATSATAGYEYPVGNHLIKFTETLNNTAVMNVQRCVIVHDDTTNPALEISDLTWDEEDMTRVSCTLVSEFDTDILAGAMVFIWEDVDSTAIASATTKFVGFVDKINGTIDPGVGVASLEIISPLAVMARTHGFSQQLTYAASPANWQETNIAHYDFWTFYLLEYHTTLLQYFDFTPTGRTSRTRNAWKSGAGSWLEAINGAVDADNAVLTQDPHGNLYLKRDPFLMTTAERAGLTTRLELTAALCQNVRYNRRIRPAVNKVEGYSFSVGTGTPTAYRSQAIGNTGGQGADGNRLTDQLCSQAELNARTGNSYAAQNNPYESINITLISGYHVINPALRHLINLTITDTTLLPEGSTEPLDFDCVPRSVSISWERDSFGNTTPLITLTLIPLTDGNATPGETMPIEARTGADITIPDIDPITGFPDLVFDPTIPFPPYFGLPPIGSGSGSGSTGTPGISLPTGTIWAIAVDFGYLTDNVSSWTQKFTQASESIASAEPLSTATESAPAFYLLTEDALYYSLNAISTAFTQKSAFAGGRLLRAVEGVTGGVLAIAKSGTTDHVSLGGEGQNGWEAVSVGTDELGTYDSGNDEFDGVQAAGGSTDNRIRIRRTYPGTVTRLQAVGEINCTATGVSNLGEVNLYANGTRFLGPVSTANGYTGDYATDSGAISYANNYFDVRYIARTYVAGTPSTTLNSVTVTTDAIVRKYSSDYGATWTTTTIAAYLGDVGADVDDYNLGVEVIAAANNLYCTSSYTGALTKVTGVSEIDGGTKITAVRIPYLKQSDASNNSATALEVWVSLEDGSTLLLTLNATTGVATKSAKTITISATTYYVLGEAAGANGNALEAYGGDANRVLAFVKPTAGGSTVLVGTTNGGTSWSIKNNSFDGLFVRFLPPDWGGDGSKILVAGTDGIAYSADMGVTLTDLTGDFASEVSALPALGAYQIDT